MIGKCDRQMTRMLHIHRPRRFQRNWFGVNRPSGCWVPASARFQEPLSCPWECPLCPYGQMTKMLHIYRPRQFQWTWFGMNRPSGYWVTASAKFGPDERPEGRTNGRRAVPLFFSERVGDKMGPHVPKGTAMTEFRSGLALETFTSLNAQV